MSIRFLPAIIFLTYFTGLNAQIIETGVTHFYADYLEGQKTASGEVFQQRLFTAAHRTLPFGTLLKLTRLDNNLSTIVRVNDRGPYATSAVISVSKAAAMQLDLIRDGYAQVRIEYADRQPLQQVRQNTQEFTARTPNNHSNNTRTFLPYTPDEDFQPNGRLFEDKKPVHTVSPEYPKPVASYDFNERGVTRGTGNGKVNLPNQFESTARTPAAPPAPTGQSGFGIQLASYKEYSNAARQMKALQDQGLDQLFLLEGANSSGIKLYRVMHGPFVSHEIADERKATLRSQFLQDGIVVRLK